MTRSLDDYDHQLSTKNAVQKLRIGQKVREENTIGCAPHLIQVGVNTSTAYLVIQEHINSKLEHNIAKTE